MNKWQKLTAGFIFLIIASIAIFDVFVISQGGTESSISQMLIVWSYKYPAFTFLFGFVMGHLFWRVRDNAQTKTLGQGEGN